METGETWDSRTRRLIGDAAADRLAGATVFVAGLGGVGGYVVEILARSGVGKLIIADADTVGLSNLNRQLIATRQTVGLPKTELWSKRLQSINPELEINAIPMFLTPENIPVILDDSRPDYVADAIDTVAPKCALIAESMMRDLPLISSMGAGGRLNPEMVRYGMLSDTSYDGLARTLRTRLRKANLNINKIQVVWSAEMPERRAIIDLDERNKKSSFGTLATVPALFGIFMANKIIRDIAQV